MSKLGATPLYIISNHYSATNAYSHTSAALHLGGTVSGHVHAQ